MTIPCSLGYEELRLRIVSEDVLRAGIFSVHDREYILCDWARGGRLITGPSSCLCRFWPTERMGGPTEIIRRYRRYTQNAHPQRKIVIWMEKT